MTDIHEMAEHLRAMGESPSSIKYLILRAAPAFKSAAGMDQDGRSGGVAVELDQVAERARRPIFPNPHTGD